MTTYVIEQGHQETRVTLAQMQDLAERNGILDPVLMEADELIDVLLDCFPDIETIEKAEG
jgi:hypothetical protein